MVTTTALQKAHSDEENTKSSPASIEPWDGPRRGRGSAPSQHLSLSLSRSSASSVAIEYSRRFDGKTSNVPQNFFKFGGLQSVPYLFAVLGAASHRHNRALTAAREWG